MPLSLAFLLSIIHVYPCCITASLSINLVDDCLLTVKAFVGVVEKEIPWPFANCFLLMYIYVDVPKILVPDDPMQVLRTRTRGIGTETYRAPEVNSGKAYNPAAADVWGLGVMLFFFVSDSQTYSTRMCALIISKASLTVYVVFDVFVLKRLVLLCV